MANSLSPLALKKIMQQAAKEKAFLKEIKSSIENEVRDAQEEFLKKFNSSNKFSNKTKRFFC